MNTPDQSPSKFPVIVTVTGPSGSGKTVLSHLLKEEGLRPLVSTTTRTPRAGEVDGSDYHFMDRATFADHYARGLFIENIEYNNTLYGVSASEAEKAFSQGKPAILVAEPHGVQQIADYAHNRGWHVLRVFVDNPEDILVGRLFNRLLLDAGRELPGPADRPHKSFAPFLERASSLFKADLSEDEASNVFRALLHDFLDSPDIPSPPSSSGQPTVEEMEKRLSAASARLANFSFEQSHWVMPARTDPELYDVVTHSFDQSVQDRVVGEILANVDDLESRPYSVSTPPKPSRRSAP